MSEFLNKYRIIDKIGEGGMGVIFKASHKQKERDLAIKILTNTSDDARRARRKFEREIEAMARLRHPNIVQIMDIGRLETKRQFGNEIIADGCSWFAMEYVSGTPLFDFAWVETDPDERWRMISELLMHLLDALGHAHARGVIHRDLKPHNMLVDLTKPDEPTVKLLDFGIARAIDGSGASEGGSGRTVTGTPKYMAPEQIRGQWQKEGPWTDLYAIGAMTWQLVTGSAPFTGDNESEVFDAHLSEELPGFDPRIPVPEGLEPWLAQLLETNPNARFRRSADAAYALTSLLDEERIVPGGLGKDAGTETDLKAPDALPTFAEMAETVFETEPSEFGGETEIESVQNIPLEELDIPPIPDDWRKDQTRAGDFLVDRSVGSKLFGLRTIPLVDRNAERDRLWGQLRGVYRTGELRGSMLRGRSGAGKTRLSEWLVCRAHELGVATILKAVHSESGAGSDGLGPMFGRYFRSRSRSWSEVFEEVKQVYSRIDMPESARVYDAMGMAELVPTQDDTKNPARGFEGCDEKHVAIRRLLEALALERPVIVWLDDLQWGEEATQLAQFLLKSEGLPAYLVLTIQKEALNRGVRFDEIVSRLQGRENVDAMELDPLSDADLYELVYQTLGVEDELSEKIVKHSEGNPLFAVQLVGNLIEQGELESTKDGLTSDRTDELELPSDISRLWQRYLHKLMDSLPDQLHPKIEKALSLAAFLGRTIPREEWLEVCAICQFDKHQRLLTEMVRLGLAEQSDAGWSFTHRLLRKTFLDEILPNDKRPKLHSECADVLEAVYMEADFSVLQRKERHLRHAERWQEACDVLRAAFLIAADEADYEKAKELLSKRQDVIDHLEGDAARKEGIENRWLSSTLMSVKQQNRDQLEGIADDIIRSSRRLGHDTGLSHGFRLKGKMRRHAGKFEESLEDLQKSMERAREASDPLSIAKTARELGLTEVRLGRPKEARTYYKEAQRKFDKLRYQSMHADIQALIGYTYSEQGKLTEAKKVLEKALKIARQVGARESEGSVWNMLGEVARTAEKPDRARECYKNTIELWQYAGKKQLEGRIRIVSINLGFTELLAENAQESHEWFHHAKDFFEEEDSVVNLAGIYLGLAASSILRRDWESVQYFYHEGNRLAEKLDYSTRDTAWLYEKIGELALREGREELASRSISRGIKRWNRLGEEEKADDLRENFADMLAI